MIRSTLKSLARKVVGRPAPASAPEPAPRPLPPVAPTPEPPDVDVDGDRAAAMRADGAPLFLLDIREPGEIAHAYAAGATLIPMNQVPSRTTELPAKDARILVYCAAGARSHGVAHWLREQGWADTWSLMGGLSAWGAGGGEVVRPAGRPKFPLASRVRVAEGAGTVQAYADGRYVVGLADGRRIGGLAEDAISGG
jgi:phage shock protein E